ncbi:HNH endonuclease [Catellatospora sp. NPDC049609]|uniref:HNH endonuclease n=1 Tax=Catellatospora sp. NPDC049609 TaxID=3155505 RepID=UPI003413693E
MAPLYPQPGQAVPFAFPGVMGLRIGSTDLHLHSALAVGQITADPATGHVSIKGRPVGRARPGGVIVVDVPRADRPGYVTVPAARIVWTVCVGPIPYGARLRHANGRAWDNRLDNLELS